GSQPDGRAGIYQSSNGEAGAGACQQTKRRSNAEPGQSRAKLIEALPHLPSHSRLQALCLLGNLPAMADWNPELYKRFRRYREEPFLAILERLKLRGDETIVDLGCGSGENTVELARRVPRGRAVGIDSSSAMIEAANKVLEGVEAETRARLRFAIGEITQFK